MTILLVWKKKHLAVILVADMMSPVLAARTDVLKDLVILLKLHSLAVWTFLSFLLADSSSRSLLQILSILELEAGLDCILMFWSLRLDTEILVWVAEYEGLMLCGSESLLEKNLAVKDLLDSSAFFVDCGLWPWFEFWSDPASFSLFSEPKSDQEAVGSLTGEFGGVL